METRKFTDYAGDDMWIAENDEPEHPGAMIDTNVQGAAPSFCVEPHRLAEVVAALYEAAGQPVPDLPVIHDQAEVERLAQLLGVALVGARSIDACRGYAYELLEHGVRLPEATP